LSAQSAVDAAGYVAEHQFVTRHRRRVRATTALARLLGAEPNSEWLRLSGLRLLADEKQSLAVSTIHVAANYADLADHPATPLFILIERDRGVRIKEIWQDVTAVPPRVGQARALRTRPGSVGLHALRRFLTADGQPAEVTCNVHPADRFPFSLRLHQA
jgi:GntR family transcriptional regulator